jgi:predicted membrane-bound spermidine synthase
VWKRLIWLGFGSLRYRIGFSVATACGMIRFILLMLAEAAVAFTTLAFELTAARLVAPHIGLSTDSWTLIITAFLAALALGNLAGGAVAGRASPAGSLALAALSCLAAAAAIDIVPSLIPHWSAAALGEPPYGMARLALFAMPPFIPAGFLLGMSTPLIVVSAIEGLARPGQAIGVLYAAGAAGSLAGTMTTLWMLHDRLGLRLTSLVLAAILLCVSGVMLASLRLLARRTA